MIRLHRLLVAGLLLGCAGLVHAQADRDDRAAAPAPVSAAVPNLAYTRYVLPNGLTLVVHEDHKAPVVAVSVWYHVGSKNEPAARSGFAHLFEHLMFQGSENHDDEYFRPFELAGTTDQNGTTWLDRTNYFQTVPTTAVNMALWMESDRMGHLLGAIGQAQLDEQRGVVQNEKRQGENQPYGRVFTVLQANAFPANHPYHHTTIGSMADLNAAALDDVKNWFREYYGAANATVVLAGDITPAQAREKVLRYFGDIGPGPRLSRPQPWAAARKESTRAVMPDKVPQTRIYREWNAPGLADADAMQLDLATTALGGGKTSRLYRRLVYQDQLADSVSMSVMPFELASMVMLQVSLRKGTDPAKVEAALNDELRRFLTSGPDADELARARTEARATFIRGIEKVGGFGGKATVLAEGQVYRKNPTAYLEDFAVMHAATPQSVRAAAQRWLGQGDFTLVVEPNSGVAASDAAYARLQTGLPAAASAPTPKDDAAAQWRAVASDVVRKNGVPEVERFPNLDFPALQRATLGNGIPVVLAARHAVPVINVELMFRGGFSSDPAAAKPGRASFTMAMLDEGTATLDSIAIARRLEQLGAELGTGASLDGSTAYLSALKDQMQPSLALLAEVVQQPAFRDADIERVRQQWLAGIAQEKAQPTGLALRIMPPLLYGASHPYAIPFSGTGTEAAVKALIAADLRAYHAAVVRPDNAQILIAGDTTLAEILPQLEAAFGRWQAPATPRLQVSVPEVPAALRVRVLLMDRPGAPQSLILAGLLAPPTASPDFLAIRAMNEVFGGSFTSRLNMNLREDKHWAYGAGTLLRDAQGQRPFLAYAPVQTDKTAESVAEILRESQALVGAQPPSREEIAKVKQSEVRKLPGTYESARAVLAAVEGIVQYGRPDDYVRQLRTRIEALDDAQVQAAARAVVQPAHYTWVVVGDLGKIEQPIRALNLGEVQVIDSEGAIVR